MTRYVCLQGGTTFDGAVYSRGELLEADTKHVPRGPSFARFSDFDAEGLELVRHAYDGAPDEGAVVELYQDAAGATYRLRAHVGTPFATFEQIPPEAVKAAEEQAPRGGYDPIAASQGIGYGGLRRSRPAPGARAPGAPRRQTDPLRRGLDRPPARPEPFVDYGALLPGESVYPDIRPETSTPQPAPAGESPEPGELPPDTLDGSAPEAPEPPTLAAELAAALDTPPVPDAGKRNASETSR